MADIIHLLPDSLANQIAAGEVIQRPASVVKELLENAIDAGAAKIQLLVKDAGRTLIQVIDNGRGMSATDARMAFERHATSKISKTEDLFAISTRGFRGEALASMAAVAQVELKSCLEEAELGTQLVVEASEVQKQEKITCPVGSNFIIRNLFFNIPARRKFLKSNNVELRHIQTEYQRVALVNPQIEFVFFNNDKLLSQLPVANLRQRISQLVKKSFVHSMLPIEVDTLIVKIHGFIARPEHARKTQNEQFFFVNGRYMRHPYFHKAVLLAYENILPANMQASYFIYLEVDSSEIDVNIHPTKTEIKFSEAQSIFQILRVSVKEALGKFNVMPSIDFNQDENWGISSPKKGETIIPPQENYNPAYNPFEENKSKEKSVSRNFKAKKDNFLPDWQKLYEGFENQNTEKAIQTEIFKSKISEKEEDMEFFSANFMQLKGNYILTSVRSGLMLIHNRRAFERVLFDDYVNDLSEHRLNVQQLLYPEELELSDKEVSLLNENKSLLEEIGMEAEFTQNRLIVNALPDGIETAQLRKLIAELLIIFENEQSDAQDIVKNHLANALAKAGAQNLKKNMSEDEMQDLSARLFTSSSPNYTHDGRKIIHILGMDEINNFF